MADLEQFALPDKAPEPPPSDYGTVAVKNSAVPDVPLPASVDAERTILGSILIENTFFDEAAEALVPDDFSLDSHKRIMQRMADLRESNIPIDIVTLSNELARLKEIESVGGVAYLASLSEGLPRRPVISEYIRIVKNKAMLRSIMMICSQAIARAADQSEPAIDVLGAAEAALLDVAQDVNDGRLRTIADSVDAAGGVDPYMAPIFNPVAMTGLRTGFVGWDAMTGGLQKKELIVVAARPSIGKSAFALDVACNVCLNDTDMVAAVFSLEMSRDSLERRLLASRARVDVQRAMSGAYLSKDERDKLSNALAMLAESKLHIDDTAILNPTQMRAKARRLKQRLGRLDLVVVDYLQLVTPATRGQNRQEDVAAISRALKALAKELEVPVLALAQLNRQNEGRSDKRPILSDLRESGSIEQDADVVAFLHRDSYYDPNNEEVQGLADLITAKSRNGPTGTVKLAFEASLTHFDNLTRSYN